MLETYTKYVLISMAMYAANNYRNIYLQIVTKIIGTCETNVRQIISEAELFYEYWADKRQIARK